MTRLSPLALAIAGMLAAAGATAAQEMSGRSGLDFAVIDTDGDGSLSRAELQARAVARLARADANGDGLLDRAEIIAILPAPHSSYFDVFAPDPAEAMADRLLALMGATETGQVEISALADRRVNTLLARVDADRDAAISQAEADGYAARRGGRGHDHDHGWRHGPEGGPGEGRGRGPGGPDDSRG